MKYIPQLDGIRAIAALLVMAYHARVPAFLGGFLGVDMFFVLSGFLITSILMREYGRSGRIDIKRFYLYRFSRLLPPLIILIVFYLSVASLVWPDYPAHYFDSAISLAYLSDYFYAYYKSPFYLVHTWSLSVEEHFYLIWPLVFCLLMKRGKRWAVLFTFLLYVLATIWRIDQFGGYGEGWSSAYYRFDTRVSGLMLGSFLAVVFLNMVVSRVVFYLFLPLLIFAGFSIYSLRWGDSVSAQLGMFIVEIATLCLIVLSVHSSKWVSFLKMRLLVYLGKLSYGLYLFHYPIMFYMRQEYSWKETFLVGSLLSFLLAVLSYHTVEAWVRNWKAKAYQRSIVV